MPIQAWGLEEAVSFLKGGLGVLRVSAVSDRAILAPIDAKNGN